MTFIHVATYLFIGIIFSKLFDYSVLFTIDGVGTYMKPAEGFFIAMGPLVQIIRGVLFGIALLLSKDMYKGKKLGWLKLWIVILVLGIINTPGPAPGSIEGIIYTHLPLEFHLKILPEIMIQTLLFSYLLSKPTKIKSSNNILNNNKRDLVPTMLAGIMFSLSGIILSFILKVDVMAGTKDIGAFVIMFIAILIVFFTNRWFHSTGNKYKWFIIIILYYIAMAILPTLYNYLTNSPFKTILTLGLNIVPVMILIGYNKYIVGNNE